MTGRARGREVLLARHRIADEHVQLDARRVSSRRAALTAHRGLHAVNVFSNRDDIRVDEIDRRRVFGDGAGDGFAVFVAERRARPQEVRGIRTAAQIDGVTRRTVVFVETLAADDHVLRRELARVLRESATTLAAATSLAAALA